MADNLAITVKGWRIYAHPLFCDQVEALIRKVERLRSKDPQTYQSKNATKQLIAINTLIWTLIPEDPAAPKYRQGKTLGDKHKHWYRAKFFQQYRLFFRYHSEQKVILYGWVNDSATKRAYKSTTDAYYIFAKMLDSGNPPTDWDDLLRACKSQERRLRELAPEDL